MADVFRELRGDYEENVGQVVNLREYLDYFEPLGSALSRLPDGVGGPFIQQFTSGGRTSGAVGWVVSAASKRYGGWKLWGMWTDGSIPPLALPLYWEELSDPARNGELLRRANADAAALRRPDRAGELLERVSTDALQDDALRDALKVQLSRLYRAPLPHERPLEVEVTRETLDLLPWIFLLGPVDPNHAQLQPSRFNGAGYQYIFSSAAGSDPAVAPEIARIVDTAADDPIEAWNLAAALRSQRSARPAPSPAKPEKKPMRETRAPVRRAEKQAVVPAAAPMNPWPYVRDVIVIALLAWIGWNVHQLRKAASVPAAVPAAMTTEASELSEPEVTETRAPDPPPPTRTERLARATARTASIRLAAGVADQMARDEALLARVAVEAFVRRNGCLPRTDAIDGKFSAAEQRAMRSCTALTTQRLMTTATEPDRTRALAWLERAVE